MIDAYKETFDETTEDITDLLEVMEIAPIELTKRFVDKLRKKVNTNLAAKEAFDTYTTHTSYNIEFFNHLKKLL